MGNTNIELFTDDQRLYFAKKTFIASGDVNSVRLAVEFDDTWANYPVRSGYFKYTGFGKPTIEREKSMGANNTCPIPHDVLENPGTLEVGVTGTSADGTQQKTTGLIKYRLHQGAKRPGIVMSPTMDLFQQLVASVKEMNDPVTKAAMQYVADQCQVKLERIQNEFESMKSHVLKPYNFSNTIHTMTANEEEWTATQDCWASLYLYSYSDDYAKMYIDNEMAASLDVHAVAKYKTNKTIPVYVQKGATIKLFHNCAEGSTDANAKVTIYSCIE